VAIEVYFPGGAKADVNNGTKAEWGSATIQADGREDVVFGMLKCMDDQGHTVAEFRFDLIVGYRIYTRSLPAGRS